MTIEKFELMPCICDHRLDNIVDDSIEKQKKRLMRIPGGQIIDAYASLHDGVLHISSRTAYELGIDISGLDAVYIIREDLKNGSKNDIQ